MRSPSACCCRGPWPWSRHRKRPSRRPRRSRQPRCRICGSSSAPPGQPSITIDPPPQRAPGRLAMPCPRFLPSGMKPRSRMTVGIHCAQSLDRLCPGQRQRAGPILRRLAHHRGRPGIDPGRPGAARRRPGRPAPGAITDPDTVAGMTAAYRITAGQPIKGAALRNAQSVVRGSNVRINAVGKGFMVSSEGQALDNAPRRAPPCRCGCPAGRWSAAWSAMPGWLKCTCRQGLQGMLHIALRRRAGYPKVPSGPVVTEA